MSPIPASQFSDSADLTIEAVISTDLTNRARPFRARNGVRPGGYFLRRLVVGVVAIGVASLALTVPAQADTVNPWQYFYDHSVYLVGDSLTCNMRPDIPYAFPVRDVVTDCYPGIVLSQADTMIRDREALPPLPPTAVVAAGGNDSETLDQFLWYVEGTIDLFPPTERILWVNYYCLLPGTNDAAKNAIVSWDATTFHHNVTVIDWASVIAPHPDDFLPDDVHYTPAGDWLRAETIAAAVGP
jgi:hypothetical protein